MKIDIRESPDSKKPRAVKYEVPMDLAKTSAQDPLAEFVPLRSVVHLVTDMGVFLTVQSRRVFVAALCMQTLNESLSRVKL